MQVFLVTYEISAATEAEAVEWAAAVAREQTIECVDEGVPHDFIFEEVLGKVRAVVPAGPGVFRAEVAYNAEVAGGALPQLLNVIYGNTSLHVAVKLVGLEVPDGMAEAVPGPRFGLAGLRDMVGRPGPLLCAAVKPIGLAPEEMAEIAYRCALGGADMIKDDHGLADQLWAPFRPRVEAMAAAVARANRETGGRTLYFPSLNCGLDRFADYARFAAEAGAGGYLVMPGLTGWDSVRMLAAGPHALPVMVHPAALGPYTNAGTNGMAHEMLYAAYPRLAGADISIYPSHGGRYGFSRGLCLSVAEACRGPGVMRPILPAPGGGLRLETAGAQYGLYGDDAVYLFGGGAMRYRDRIAEGIGALKAALA
ncbi:MAG: RuBisCO large subunit C-terminal-like domain-containing protein [Pseudomonadota bacterium]